MALERVLAGAITGCLVLSAACGSSTVGAAMGGAAGDGAGGRSGNGGAAVGSGGAAGSTGASANGGAALGSGGAAGSTSNGGTAATAGTTGSGGAGEVGVPCGTQTCSAGTVCTLDSDARCLTPTPACFQGCLLIYCDGPEDCPAAQTCRVSRIDNDDYFLCSDSTSPTGIACSTNADCASGLHCIDLTGHAFAALGWQPRYCGT